MTDTQAPSRPDWHVRLATDVAGYRTRGRFTFSEEVQADIRACLSALDAATERARVAEEERQRASLAAERLNEGIASLRTRLAAVQPLVEQIGRIARSDGQRTFDDCIADLSRIDDLCRSAKGDSDGR